MKRSIIAGSIAITVTMLGAPSLASAQDARANRLTAERYQVEEIYIARSVRKSREKPTAFCNVTRTGFKADREDQYTFQATATNRFSGRMTETNGTTIGTGHGCIGPTADSTIFNFYLDLRIGNTSLTGIGDCRNSKPNFPEQGLTVERCFLDLSDPLGRYIGGQLTTNTMASRKLLGVESDPPGYTQPSIATIRLWKKRT